MWSVVYSVMSYTSPCTGINSIADNINTIQIGNIKLPGGFETVSGILKYICKNLDIRSLLNFKETSLIKQLKKKIISDNFESVHGIELNLGFNEMIQTHPARRLYLLIERYKKEFPCDPEYTYLIPTPIICACEEGRIDDIKLFMDLHPFHQYITNRDVNLTEGYRLKDMVNQIGRNTIGWNCWTLLMIAALNDNFQMVQYLIENCEVDPNVTNKRGYNALHYAARYNTNINGIFIVQVLVNCMSLDSINKKELDGYTPLDWAYIHNDSPLRQDIIEFLRSKGGKANYHDENGINVGRGNGDLND